ncbi:MAG: hypothetical protein JWM68_1132 [Verrucomicrobiales bacterium]|nr:hypothetical protein [Verrucomicrobiales bacterium]
MKLNFEVGGLPPTKKSTSAPIIFKSCKSKVMLERVDINGWGSFGFSDAGFDWYELRDHDVYGENGLSIGGSFIQLGHAEMRPIRFQGDTSMWLVIGFATNKSQMLP